MLNAYWVNFHVHVYTTWSHLLCLSIHLFHRTIYQQIEGWTVWLQAVPQKIQEQSYEFRIPPHCWLDCASATQRCLDKPINQFHRACQTQITPHCDGQTAGEFECQTPFPKMIEVCGFSCHRHFILTKADIVKKKIPLLEFYVLYKGRFIWLFTDLVLDCVTNQNNAFLFLRVCFDCRFLEHSTFLSHKKKYGKNELIFVQFATNQSRPSPMLHFWWRVSVGVPVQALVILAMPMNASFMNLISVSWVIIQFIHGEKKWSGLVCMTHRLQNHAIDCRISQKRIYHRQFCSCILSESSVDEDLSSSITQHSFESVITNEQFR
jgi:hypothetical protein